MHRAWPLRSAWAWRYPQRKAKRSLGEVGRPGTGTAIGDGGGDGGRDGALILALALNPGVIAGGAQAAARFATGGNGQGRAAARPISLLTRCDHAFVGSTQLPGDDIGRASASLRPPENTCDLAAARRDGARDRRYVPASVAWRARQAKLPRAAPSLMSCMPSRAPSSQRAVTGVLAKRKNESRIPKIPLTITQPQFGRGRIVSEKMTLEKPSTMKSTIRRSVSERRPAPGLRSRSTPTTINNTPDRSCIQTYGTLRTSIRLMPCRRPLIISSQPR